MAKETQIGALLKQLAQTLDSVSESPRLDAEILLRRAMGRPRSYLFAHPDDCLDDAAIARLERSVERRLGGEPMAYITGSREFWSMELAVSPATLVPRPETEILVEVALRAIPRNSKWKILDLGTGCGAIALAIARERPRCDVVAVDRSVEALQIATLNARELAIANVSFVAGNWTGAVGNELFNVIVSNPPYVRDDDEALLKLTQEPRAALAAGPDGLDAIRILARDCLHNLAPGGLFALEHGARQQDSVAALLAGHGWLEIACHEDYAGLPRVTIARSPAPAGKL